MGGRRSGAGGDGDGESCGGEERGRGCDACIAPVAPVAAVVVVARVAVSVSPARVVARPRLVVTADGSSPSARSLPLCVQWRRSQCVDGIDWTETAADRPGAAAAAAAAASRARARWRGRRVGRWPAGGLLIGGGVVGACRGAGQAPVPTAHCPLLTLPACLAAGAFAEAPTAATRAGAGCETRQNGVISRAVSDVGATLRDSKSRRTDLRIFCLWLSIGEVSGRSLGMVGQREQSPLQLWEN